MHTETPIQMLSLAETCKLLCKSRSGLYKLMASDTSFPRPIKDGTARQARVVFVSSELAVWQKSKLAARTAIANLKSDVQHQSEVGTETAAILSIGEK
ncbi:Prophage CP4-57 regulatory protein (AlpA) [compost metagenome]